MISDEEIDALAKSFKFEMINLPNPLDLEKKYQRNVNPNLEHISSWISAVGSAIAINDIDSDGLPNDTCSVDPRTNTVLIAPIPGTGNRYTPIILTPEPLHYNHNTMAPMGCLPSDFNEDGDLDLLVYYWGRTPIIFYKIEKAYKPTELVLNNERWYTNAVTVSDLDGDSHMDIIIGNYFKDNAHILDSNTNELDSMQDSMSRAFNGGGTHIFLWDKKNSENNDNINFIHYPNMFDSKINFAWTLAIATADLDGDLLPEIYFANDFGPDRLMHNRSSIGELKFTILESTRDFTTPSSKVLGKDSFKGMGVDFSDINNDGILDIFVSNIASEFALQESHFMFISTGNIKLMKQGVAPYTDKSELLGLSRSDWSWDAKFVDMNNDSIMELIQATGFVKGRIDRWPELQELALSNDELLKNVMYWPKLQEGDDLSGNAHNPFFAKMHDGKYYDISMNLNVNQNQISRGIATADVDGDGDIDFIVSNQWADSKYYRNDCPSCGDFLGLRLRYPINVNSINKMIPKPNQFIYLNPSRAAINATVKIILPNGKILFSEVDGGNGHSGKRSHDLHFGLGKLTKNTRVDVEVKWRDRRGNIRNHNYQLVPGWYTIELDVGV